MVVVIAGIAVAVVVVEVVVVEVDVVEVVVVVVVVAAVVVVVVFNTIIGIMAAANVITVTINVKVYFTIFPTYLIFLSFSKMVTYLLF